LLFTEPYNSTEPVDNSTAPVGNEGKRFAFALPPADFDVGGELILHARQDTTIFITYPFLINEQIVVEADKTTHYQLDGLQFRCTEGIEHKGITLTSMEPFSAHLTNAMYTDDCNPDSTILRPIPDGTDDIYLMSYSEGSTNTSSRPQSFYMVVGNESDTDVVVYRHEGGSLVILEEFTLGPNEVFTGDSYDVFTGSFVRASKPVAVYSGHGYAQVPVSVSLGLYFAHQLDPGRKPPRGLKYTVVNENRITFMWNLASSPCLSLTSHIY
jgi:hypothetical protein